VLFARILKYQKTASCARRQLGLFMFRMNSFFLSVIFITVLSQEFFVQSFLSAVIFIFLIFHD